MPSAVSTWKRRREMGDKPLVWMAGRIRTPPFSPEARLEAGMLLRRLQQGENPGLPHSRPRPQIGARCHELRVRDETRDRRIFYPLSVQELVILEIHQKKTPKTPPGAIAASRHRLKAYQDTAGPPKENAASRPPDSRPAPSPNFSGSRRRKAPWWNSGCRWPGKCGAGACRGGIPRWTRPPDRIEPVPDRQARGGRSRGLAGSPIPRPLCHRSEEERTGEDHRSLRRTGRGLGKLRGSAVSALQDGPPRMRPSQGPIGVQAIASSSEAG